MKLQDGKEQLSGKVAGLRSAAARAANRPATSGRHRRDGAGVTGQLSQRWKPLVALTASAAALVFLLRKLIKG